MLTIVASNNKALACGKIDFVDDIIFKRLTPSLVAAIYNWISRRKEHVEKEHRQLGFNIPFQSFRDELVSSVLIYIYERKIPLDCRKEPDALLGYLVNKGFRRLRRGYQRGLLYNKKSRRCRVKINSLLIDEHSKPYSYSEVSELADFEVLSMHTCKPKEFARIVGVDNNKVYSWIKSGVLKTVGGGSLLATYESYCALRDLGLLEGL